MRSMRRTLRWATLAAVVCACSAAASGQRWATVIDAKSGRTYYWNKETRETTWLRPAELDEPPPAESPARDEAPASSGASTTPSTASPEQRPAVQPAAARPQCLATLAGQAQSGLARCGSIVARALQEEDKLTERSRPALPQGLVLSSVLLAAAAFL